MAARTGIPALVELLTEVVSYCDRATKTDSSLRTYLTVVDDFATGVVAPAYQASVDAAEVIGSARADLRGRASKLAPINGLTIFKPTEADGMLEARLPHWRTSRRVDAWLKEAKDFHQGSIELLDPLLEWIRGLRKDAEGHLQEASQLVTGGTAEETTQLAQKIHAWAKARQGEAAKLADAWTKRIEAWGGEATTHLVIHTVVRNHLAHFAEIIAPALMTECSQLTDALAEDHQGLDPA